MSTEELDKQAKQAYEKKEYGKAAELFLSAAHSCHLKGDTLQAAEMLNNSSVSWLQADEAQKALEATEGTDAIFSDAGDLRRQAMALGNQAAALDALGRLNEAVQKYQSASEILKDIDNKELRTYVLQNLAALQLRTGDQFQSLATMQAALEHKKKLSIKERFLKKLLRIPFKLMK